MGDVITVEPREDAYVNEWRAIKFDIGDWQSIKRLLRPSGRSVFVDLEPESGPVLIIVGHGVTIRIEEGAWVVLSPHDKVITMAEPDMFENFRSPC